MHCQVVGRKRETWDVNAKALAKSLYERKREHCKRQESVSHKRESKKRTSALIKSSRGTPDTNINMVYYGVACTKSCLVFG